MTMRDALKGAIDDVVPQTILAMWPQYNDMDEATLKLVVEKLQAARQVQQCPYSKSKLLPHGIFGRTFMQNADGTLVVGTEKLIRIRAARDNAAHGDVEKVHSIVSLRYAEMVKSREQREQEEKALQQQIAPIVELAETLTLINTVDGLILTQDEMDAQLCRTARQLNHKNDALKLYFERINRKFPAAAPEAKAAPELVVTEETEDQRKQRNFDRVTARAAQLREDLQKSHIDLTEIEFDQKLEKVCNAEFGPGVYDDYYERRLAAV